jgi:divalent metal cation (Fe/Co/Zn/Cd) transporter
MQIAALLVAGMCHALLGSVKVPLARKLKIDEARVGGLVSLFGFTLIPVIPMAGLLTDQVGRPDVFIGGSALFGALMAEEVRRVAPELAPYLRVGASLPTLIPPWSLRMADSVMSRTPDPLMLDATVFGSALSLAGLVLLAAGRLIRRNVDVLMDRAPADVEATARAAIAAIEPPISLSRLRLRQAAGRTFADVVISVPPGAVVGQGHAVADRVEAELEEALPGSDVVVHVEPGADEVALRDRALAAAMSVPRVREIHNLSIVSLGGAIELSLHLKLPGDLPLDQAHEIAAEVEHAIVDSVPEIASVQTHLEPLAEVGAGELVEAAEIEAAAERAAGGPLRELRLLRTEKGVVAFITLGLDPATTLADAHSWASEVEERLRRARPDVADVIVHTEP